MQSQRERVCWPPTLVVTMAEEAYYTEPNASEPCYRCKFRQYDSFHGEQWCAHDPKPEMIGWMRIVDSWGHCEYWEDGDR